MAIHAFGTHIEAHGTEFEVFARTYLLFYHFFHFLLCTIDGPMCTSRRNQLYIRSFHAHWKAHCSPVSRDSVLRCSFVHVFHCEKGKGTHPLAQRAGKFFSQYGAAHGRAQEPTPGSTAKHCWFLVTGGGEGTIAKPTNVRNLPTRTWCAGAAEHLRRCWGLQHVVFPCLVACTSAPEGGGSHTGHEVECIRAPAPGGRGHCARALRGRSPVQRTTTRATSRDRTMSFSSSSSIVHVQGPGPTVETLDSWHSSLTRHPLEAGVDLFAPAPATSGQCNEN